ncbi:MAG: hypothetical protein PHD06_07530 [Bacteroidales bacterium]|jgi:hypothetical protein|nr:hypothetical protein [Bacteroidales bacterium]MDD4385015.1 hypothetical protein [Bacteroidales bacterium]MDY0196677.1 hypothetical protein [Tenuifilaceae bacterium]
MRKIIFIILLIFTALIFSCESNLQNFDGTVEEVENIASDNAYLKLLEQNPNLDEILVFLGASSIEDLDAKLAEKPNNIATKDLTDFPEYVLLTAQHNSGNQPSGEEKLVTLKLSPENDNLKLSSTISKNEINDIGIIEGIIYNNDERAEGMILIEYDIEKELFRFSMDGFNSKRSCFGDCMAAKGKELEDSNWIEQIAFCAGCPLNMAVWAASCAWDCATN